MSIASNFPAIKPTLLLDFANTEELDPRITFTRASTATYFDAFGVIRTAPSGVARFDHNPATFENLGLLLEEQRTNLLLNSGSLATQNITVTAVSTTLSFYGTGTVTLSGASTAGPLVGTGSSNRVSLTFTPTAGTLTLTVSGSVGNAQLEAGAFATSYIPTVASQVTRAADAASMTGADFSSWYNQAEGTLYSESSRPFPVPSGGVARVFEINDGTVNNRLINSYHSATAALFFVGANNSTQANISLTTSAVGRKLASAYQLNNFAASVNGGTVGTSATGILPVVTQAQIGSSGSTTLNGHIRKIAYYPIRVSNTNLQALTS
jgi:hypothetical protein